MIEYIVGEIKEIGEDYIILEVNEVGYMVYLSSRDLSNINVLEKRKIYIYRHFYENGEDWYGFIDKEAKIVFSLLTTVSGIGPRIALKILSSLSYKQVIGAIVSKDVSLLSSVKGISNKTAEKIVTELKDIVVKMNISVQRDDGKMSDLILALKSLGYQQSEIFKAINLAKAKYKEFEEADISKAIQICLSILKKS